MPICQIEEGFMHCQKILAALTVSFILLSSHVFAADKKAPVKEKSPASSEEKKVTVYNEDFEKGQELFQLNKPEEAIEFLEKAVTDPNVDPKVYVYLGVAYFQVKKYQESMDICARGLARKDTDRKVLAYNAGNSAYAIGNYARADACYAISLREDADYAPAVLNRANTLLKQDRLEESRDHYVRYLELEKESEQKERIELVIQLLEEEILRRANQKPERIELDDNLQIENAAMEVSEEIFSDDSDLSLPEEKAVAENRAVAEKIDEADATAPEVPAEQLEEKPVAEVVEEVAPPPPAENTPVIEDSGEVISLEAPAIQPPEKPKKAAGEIVRTQAPELPKEAEREFEPIFEDTDIPPEDYWE